MAISYNKLWKLLIDRKVSPSALRRATDVSPNTFTKLHKDELVSMDVLCRICKELNVDFGDIIEYYEE